MIEGISKEVEAKIKNPHIKKLKSILEIIEKEEEALVGISEEEIREKTKEFKERIAAGESLDDLLPEAYALACVAVQKFHMNHFSLRTVQKMTGVALHYGTIAELGTGEGKTLSAVLPAYLNALTGEGVHVISANSYLSERDYSELKPIFEGLGLTVGYVDDSHANTPEVKAKKREAYQADITYGANSTFIFDYLHDTHAKDESEIVQRSEKPGFALIDEVDDALLDRARVPFVISSKARVYQEGMSIADFAALLNTTEAEIVAKARQLGISVRGSFTLDEAGEIAEEGFNKTLYRADEALQEQANYIVGRLLLKRNMNGYSGLYACEDDVLKGRTRRALFEFLQGTEEDAYTDEELQVMESVHENCNVISCTSGMDTIYAMTERGNAIFENYAFFRKIYDNPSLLEKVQLDILDCSDLQYEVDYGYDRNHRLMFKSPEGLAKAIQLVPSVAALEEEFLLSDEFLALRKYVNNSLEAYLNKHENIDYIVTSVNGRRKVQLVNSGRVSQGMQFGDGLQQAIEFKEQSVKGMRRRLNVSSFSDTMASISQKGYYDRYGKMSGMTGTSSSLGFARLYNKTTVEIPRSAHYEYYTYHTSGRRKRAKMEVPTQPKVVERKPDVFSTSVEEKYQAMLASIMASKSKNPPQPILITTTSIEESERLATFLRKNSLECNVLNAAQVGDGSNKAKKRNEAEIIARAGEVGRITIATEMAGRGTDIKLGGDRDKLTEIFMERYIESKSPQLDNLTSQARAKLYASCQEYLTKKGVILPKEQAKFVKSRLEEEGLKIICSGHYALDRVDRQIMGRTGRNGIGGEVQFFSSCEDFVNMGASPQEAVDLFEELAENPQSKAVHKKLMKKIKTVQAINEDSLINTIDYTHELDFVASRYRAKLHTERMRLLKGFEGDGRLRRTKVDYGLRVDEMIERVVGNMMVDNVLGPFNQEFAPDECNFDVETFSLELLDTFGIHLDPAIVPDFETLKELKTAIISTAQAKHHRDQEANPALQEEKDKNILLASIDRAVEASREVEDLISRQKNIDISMGQKNFTYLRDFDIYAHAEARRAEQTSLKFFFDWHLTREQKETLNARREERYQREQNDSYVALQAQKIEKMRSEDEREKEEMRLANLNIRGNIVSRVLRKFKMRWAPHSLETDFSSPEIETGRKHK